MPGRASICALSALLFAVVHVAGCGQTGPLYLPSETSPTPAGAPPDAAPDTPVDGTSVPDRDDDS